ncbi:MAG: indolepyruvate oxidoreductase subunit beta [Clostridiales bacterium]|nr:indolepyruvate oxidoreductase subunit beta [Clostridiales bacterium]
MSTTNIILCGVGGQGTVLASKLTAAASMAKGLNVRSAETIGMAQRGGSVLSYLRIGECASPLINSGCADLIIGFEPAETVRALSYLKEGGIVITSDRAMMPVTAALKGSDYEGSKMTDYLKSLEGGRIGKLVIVNTDDAMRDLGSPKAMNMVLLGAAARGGFLGEVTIDDIRQALVKKVKPQFHELNFKALEYASV